MSVKKCNPYPISLSAALTGQGGLRLKHSLAVKP